jgi:hypothetical protein
MFLKIAYPTLFGSADAPTTATDFTFNNPDIAAFLSGESGCGTDPLVI